MQITWNGHANFSLQDTQARVLIDPFFANPALAPADWREVRNLDIVLVTHDHGDHVGDAIAICTATGAMLGCVVGTGEALINAGLPHNLLLNGIGFNLGGTLVHKGVHITMVPAFHTSESGVPVGYIIRMPDGGTVYHAGDTCLYSDMALFARIYPIDVALLPIGGLFTMDAVQAAMACNMLQCPKVIPMHYGTFPVLQQNTEAFTQELARHAPGCTCLALAPGDTLTLK